MSGFEVSKVWISLVFGMPTFSAMPLLSMNWMLEVWGTKLCRWDFYTLELVFNMTFPSI